MTSLAIRGLRTTARQSALRPRGPASPSASQPVLKGDARPAPSPPARPSPSPRPSPSLPSAPSPTPPPTRSGGKPGSIYASYKALPYNTKLVFWTGGAVFAVLGLLAADKLEELFPARNNKAIRPGAAGQTQPASAPKLIDHPDAQTESAAPTTAEPKKPRLFSISVVDRS
ncbi:hypothetical protein PSEUBRA_003386 [Kalmanozyma brasiliensis GHG001]|uniref:uncharacterized protein n=1 Tax=Kalmanozyma brasiliensis (strain GHG001) TaxID=1365824 RepID=UPI002867D4BE|nr:uncharacterized protein PSEUBRA_003386 [Kalmanozyma brasiliensis GHG001]KAF6767233.1 hypothetical protein PSEUBRA_003386 [Kalmanozyma brasiliensis GHG001]